MDKYRGRVIQDTVFNREITVEYIFDLSFEDLDLEDQKLAMKTGWAFGVGDKADFEKCTKFKGYLFGPRQWRLWHAKEKFPAFIAAEGTGKTLIFWLFLIRLCLQYPGTRVLFMRASYPQLIKASLPTLWKIFQHFGWKEDKHYIHHISDKVIKLKVGDKISEILYMPAKNEGGQIMDIIADIRSLEIDCAVVDEVANIEELIILSLSSRPGRWGKVSDISMQKLIVGGNPPPEGSWQHKRWYMKLDSNDNPIDDPEEHTVFVASTYENRRNVSPTIIKSLEASPEYWKRTFLYGQLGFVPPNGEPVYKYFSQHYNLFVSQEALTYNPALPMLRGFDIGPTAKNKAVVVGQLDPKGVLLILAEFMILDPGIVRFGNYVVEQCNALFPGVQIWRDFSDPVAFHISQTDGNSPAGLLADCGIHLIAGEESFQLRTDAVEQIMSRFIDGSPGILIDGTRCPKLVQGMMGGYRYKIVDSANERFSREPIKDNFSHYCDALAYLCSRLAWIDNKKRDNSPRAESRRNAALLNKRKRHMGGYSQAKLDRLRG